MMSYSKNLKRAAMAKRVIISWVVVAVLFSLVGFGIGYTLETHITANGEPKTDGGTIEPVIEELRLYGTCKDWCITGGTPLDWGNGNLNFIPLDVPMDEELQEFVFYLSDAYNIDFAFVMAVIQQESDFETNLVSTTNDYGLMQINQINHTYLTEALGITDFLDPYQNVRAGISILHELFEKYDGADLVLMAYNMGETGASRLWDKGIYETRHTKAVLKYQLNFNEQLEGDTNAGKLEGS